MHPTKFDIVVPSVCSDEPFVCHFKPGNRPFVRHKAPSVGFHSSSGFTLIELIIAMTIVGILTALAFPSFREFIQNQRLSTQTNELVSDLAFARSEAVKRKGPVTVCVSTSGTGCTAGDWEAGRIVFSDANGDGTVDAGDGDTVLRAREKLDSSITLRSLGVATTPLSFGATGAIIAGGPVTFALCDGRGASKGRAVLTNPIGQARVDQNAPANCT